MQTDIPTDPTEPGNDTTPDPDPTPTWLIPGHPSYLFADCEASGKGRGAYLLEACLRRLDRDLDPIPDDPEGHWIFPYDRRTIAMMRAAADPKVRAMHDTNGLWDACAAAWDEAQQALTGPNRDDPVAVTRAAHNWLRLDIYNWVARHPTPLPMAGSSVHTDRAWLTDRIPGLERHLQHRVIDVSTIMELLKRWRPDVLDAPGAPTPQRLHRAQPCLDNTIIQLRYYRAALGLYPAAILAAV